MCPDIREYRIRSKKHYCKAPDDFSVKPENYRRYKGSDASRYLYCACALKECLAENHYCKIYKEGSCRQAHKPYVGSKKQACKASHEHVSFSHSFRFQAYVFVE